MDKRGRLRTGLLSGLAIGVLFSGLYLATLAPGVLPYAQVTQDSPALQATVPNLGVSHPTGYPVYMMLAHLFTYLPVGEVAYRVNLASAAFAVLAVVLVYLAGIRLSGRALAAAVGAVAFGLGHTFWVQAVIAEVYTLNAAFMALVPLLLLVWRERRQDRYLLLCALFGGLSMSNHLTSGLLIPAGLAFVWLTDRRVLARPGIWARGCGLFFLGLLPYVYLPLRASQSLPENTGDLSTLRGVVAMISGGPFKGWMFAFGPLELVNRIGLYLGYLVGQFSPLLLLVGVFGAVCLALRDRAGAALTGVIFVGTFVFSVQYAVTDVYVFFIPTYLVMALWISVGIGALWRLAEDRVAGGAGGNGGALFRRLGPRGRATLAPAVPVLGLAVALLGVVGTYAEVDRSQDRAGREMIRAVVQEVEPGATVVHRRSPLLYMQMVEHRREDITLWDFREPHTIAEIERADRALDRGDLYFLEPDQEMIDRFEEGGYDMIPVEGDMLYRAERSEEEISYNTNPGERAPTLPGA